MSNSNSNDSRSPGLLTGAMIGRIIAVVGFIALGTFAVIHSTRNNPEQAKVDETDSTEEGSTQQASLFTSDQEEDGSSVTTASLQEESNASPASTTPQVSTAPGAFGGANPRPLQNRSGTNQVVAGRQTLPETPQPRSFGAAPRTNSPVRVARAPQTQTPGSTTSGGTSTGTPGLNLRNPINGAIEATSDFAGTLRDEAGEAAGNLLNQTREGLNNATSGLRNTLSTTGQSSDPQSTTRSGTPGAFGGTGQQPSPRSGMSMSDLNPMSPGQRSNGNIRTPGVTTPPSTRDQRSTFGSATDLQPVNAAAPRPQTRSFGENQPMTPMTPVRPSGMQQSGTQRSATQQSGTIPGSMQRTGISQTGSSRGGLQPTNQERDNSTFNSNPVSPRSRPIPTTQVSTVRPVTAPATQSTPGDRELEGAQTHSLTIEKIAPREIQVNQPADFQIIVRNTGRVTAKDVQVTDQVPEGTELLKANPQPTAGAGGYLWQLGEIRPGQEKRINMQLRPTRPGEIGSVAQVFCAAQASMRTLVTKPVLSITHSSAPRTMIGDNVILDITVENTGDGAAYEVVVQDDVPSQLEIPTHLRSPDGTRGVEYPIGTLAPGQSKNLKLSLKAAEIGRMRNILTATGKGIPNAQHAIDLEVISPTLVASGTGPRMRFINREATHEFSVTNKGTAAATNVELIARLPSGLRFVNANNRGRYDANTHAVYWSLAELTENLTADVQVSTMPTEPGEQKIEFETFADLGRKATAAQVMNVDHLVDIYFEIDDVTDLIEIGSDTSYRIRLVNQGTIAAGDIQLKVDFPEGLQPTSIESNLPNQIQGNRVVFSPITSMSPGDEIRLEIKARGTAPGDHRVAAHVQTAGRETLVTKEETTRVYNDR